ncbi:hypothetical protein A0J61_10069, partial [Choanephora cucurbitarum]
MIQTYSRHRTSWRTHRLKQLQSQHNSYCRQYRSDPLLLDILVSPLQKEISNLQAEVSQTHRLRAGKRWLENHEHSAGYLQRTITARARKRNIGPLTHPVTGLHCSDTASKLDAVTSSEATNEILSHITKSLDPDEAKTAVLPFSLADIQLGASRSPRCSSPEKDGLPYEILQLLFKHPA